MVAAMRTFSHSFTLPDSKARTVFLVLLLVCGSGLISPALALVIGCAYALTQAHPFAKESHTASRFLLQASVVALGFGMNAREVLHAGRAGVGYTAVGIAFAMTLGLSLGWVLKVRGKASFLITAGTAICGGSAIAALSPLIDADAEEISVSMAAVFALNAVALILFPAIGFALHMTQPQFGLWAALAIHDTSSVVGASARYGNEALAIGTAVKLARALWIVPVSLVTAAVVARMGQAKTAAKVKVPWFIALFCGAAALNSGLPAMHGWFGSITTLGRDGLTATLFLIGTGLSRATLAKVGVRPLLQAVGLWVVVASATLFAIVRGVIAF
jgi:uncharacterized integral membrane protein (TIGR00698 family)